MALIGNGQEFESEFEWEWNNAMQELAEAKKPMLEDLKGRFVKSKLDPVSPFEEKYDDQPTFDARTRENPFNDAVSPYRYLKHNEKLIEGAQDSISDQQWADEFLNKPTDWYGNTKGLISAINPSSTKTPIIGTPSGEKATEGQRTDYVKQAPERTTWGMLTGNDDQERFKLWPERFARHAVDSAYRVMGMAAGTREVPLPSKTPDITNMVADYDIEEERKRNLTAVWDVASAITLAPAPIVAKSVDGSLGSIAGVSSKTADKETLTAAQVLDRRGYPNEEIFQTTGWYKGFDGAWKYEIPTEGIKYNTPQLKVDSETINFLRRIDPDMNKHSKTIEHKADFKAPLPEVVELPALYKAYPELTQVPVVYDAKTAYLAYFQPGAKPYIGISPSFLKLTKDEQLDVMLHEIQHWIQRKEHPNFDTARGDPANQQKMLFEFIKDTVNTLKVIDPQKAVTRAQEFTQVLRDLKKEHGDIGQFLYKRDPGEREANLAAWRRYLTKTEKKEESPVSYQQTADELQNTREFRFNYDNEKWEAPRPR